MSGGKFSVEAVFRALDNFSSVVGGIEKNTKRLLKGVSGAVAGLNGVVDKAISGLKTVAAVAGTVAVAAGAALLKLGETGADFEQAITNVGAVSLMTRKEVAELEKEARRLGSTLDGFGFTATQVAGAMELMGKAGFTNQEIMQSIGGILGAAAAEGATLEDIAGLVSNTLKGMGMEAKETARVADVLTLASARTNSSISSLGESMGILSSTARQFKIPFEQAVASVALLQDVGLDASTAGTAVSTMLTKLASPTKEIAAQMDALGIKFQDAKGNMLPLAQVFAQFDKAGKKAGGNMKAVAFFADLVGLRGQKAALNLKDLFATGKFGDLVKELEGAAGSAQKMATIRMDTLKGDLTLLSNAADDVKISLFDMESGPLRDVVKGITAWVTANKELIVQKVGDTIKSIADHMPEIVTWGERIGKAFLVFAAISAAIKVASAAMAVFNFIVAANPIALVVLAVGAAIAAIVAFWPEISAFFGRVWDGIKKIASGIAASVASAFMAVWEPLKAFFRATLEVVVGIFSLLFPMVIPMFVAGYDFIVAHWGQITGFFSAIWEGITKAASVAWAGLKAAAAKFAFDTVKAIWAPIGAFFSAIWDGIASGFKKALGWAIEKISGMLDALRAVGRAALGTEPPEVPGAPKAGDDGAAPYGPPAPTPQVVPPRGIPTDDRGAYNDSTSTERIDMYVNAPKDRVRIERERPTGRSGLTLIPSGSFA